MWMLVWRKKALFFVFLDYVEVSLSKNFFGENLEVSLAIKHFAIFFRLCTIIVFQSIVQALNCTIYILFCYYMYIICKSQGVEAIILRTNRTQPQMFGLIVVNPR